MPGRLGHFCFKKYLMDLIHCSFLFALTFFCPDYKITQLFFLPDIFIYHKLSGKMELIVNGNILHIKIMRIEKAKKGDYQILIKIWEASVRATHDFLEEEYLLVLKYLILDQYFDAVDLLCAKDKHDNILGFCGVRGDKIEMLFVSPDIVGTGVGSSLMENAIHSQNAAKVDVNEQNKQALKFYEHIGFKVVGRSPLDGQGKPYPLLHMELNLNIA